MARLERDSSWPSVANPRPEGATFLALLRGVADVQIGVRTISYYYMETLTGPAVVPYNEELFVALGLEARHWPLYCSIYSSESPNVL